MLSVSADNLKIIIGMSEFHSILFFYFFYCTLFNNLYLENYQLFTIGHTFNTGALLIRVFKML